MLDEPKSECFQLTGLKQTFKKLLGSAIKMFLLRYTAKFLKFKGNSFTTL